MAIDGMTNTATIGRGLVFAVLLVAGLAKLASVATYGGDYATLVMSVLQGLLEIYLGVIYASRWQSGIMRRFMLGVFTVFLAYNVYLIAQGASSCGCYGSIRVAPIYSAGLNLGLLLAIYLTPTISLKSFELGPVSWGVLVASTIVGLLGIQFPKFGESLRQTAIVSPIETEIEYDFLNGYSHRFPLTISNVSSESITVVGWDSNHLSARFPDFTRTAIAPNQSHTFELLLEMSPLDEKQCQELIDGLNGFESRAEMNAWRKLRSVVFLNQYGEEFAKFAIKERIPMQVLKQWEEK